MSTTKKKPSKTAKKTTAKGGASTKVGWTETIKKALEKKRPAGGWPDQPKPRDSGIQKVKKNSF